MTVRIAGSLFRCILTALFLVVTGGGRTDAAGAQDAEILTNESVIQMTTAKLERDIVIGKINSARPGFDLSSAGLVSLTNAKIDERVIKQMLTVGHEAQRSGSAPPDLRGLDEVLTNDAVIKMWVANVKKPLIVQKMAMSRPQFDISSAGLIELNKAKVPKDLIQAMMAPPATVALTERAKGADSSKNPSPRNAAPKADGPNSVAIYPLSAGGLPQAARYQIESNPIHASVSMRIAQAFTSSGQWQVSNRSADVALQNELERSRSIQSFKSPVIVKDNAQVNARFAVLGLLDQVAVRQSMDKSGCATHNVTLHFTSEFGDVQSGLSLASKSFTATFPSTNAETLKQVATAKAMHRVTRLGEKCKETQSDALDYALIDVVNQTAAWAKAVYLKRPAK